MVERPASRQHSTAGSISAESCWIIGGSRDRPRAGLTLRFGSAGNVSKDELDNLGTGGKNVSTTRGEARSGRRGMAAANVGSFEGTWVPQRQERRRCRCGSFPRTFD